MEIRVPICPKCKVSTKQTEYEKKLGYSKCPKCGESY